MWCLSETDWKRGSLNNYWYMIIKIIVIYLIFTLKNVALSSWTLDKRKIECWSDQAMPFQDCRLNVEDCRELSIFYWNEENVFVQETAVLTISKIKIEPSQDQKIHTYKLWKIKRKVYKGSLIDPHTSL